MYETETSEQHRCERDCYGCGQHVRRSQRIRVQAGWICRGCLEADAYRAGYQDATEKVGA